MMFKQQWKFLISILNIHNVVTQHLNLFCVNQFVCNNIENFVSDWEKKNHMTIYEHASIDTPSSLFVLFSFQKESAGGRGGSNFLRILIKH